MSKPSIEMMFEKALFASRWLMAPIYAGLVLALLALVWTFFAELAHELPHLMSGEAHPEDAILLALALIDLSLAGNLVLIVIFSGYENFVSKLDTDQDADRPEWMGTIDFSGLKMKLIGSIVAISAIALLRAFLELTEGAEADHAALAWLVGIHVSFVFSGLLLALMDWVAARASKH